MKLARLFSLWLGVAALTLAVTSRSFADEGDDDQGDGNGSFAITSARQGAGSTITLTIANPSGKKGDTPSVTLGGVALPIVSATTVFSGRSTVGTVVATLPASATLGTYGVKLAWGEDTVDNYSVTLGLSGAVGPVGLSGPKGAKGATGPTGPAGVAGAAGATGAAGPAGNPGSAGSAGMIGAVGPRGAQGAFDDLSDLQAIVDGLAQEIAAVRAGLQPGVPVVSTATAQNASATIAFASPAGALPITSYTVTSSPGGLTATGAGSPLTVTGLTSGTTYTFTVTATNAAGTSAASASSAPVTPVAATTVPSAPVIDSVTSGNSSVTVSFTPPSTTGGSPITSYQVVVTPGGQFATGTSSPITVFGLTNGQSVSVVVSAINALGTSPYSDSSGLVVPSTVPDAPVILSAVGGDRSAVISFARPNDGGAMITNFTVTTSPGGATFSGSTSPIVVGGLNNGESYIFTVVATNARGNSVPSAPSASVVPSSGIVVTRKLLLTLPSDGMPFSADFKVSGPIDVQTGFVVYPDGHEVNPLSGETVIPAYSPAPRIFALPPTSIYLLFDPISGLYVTYYGTWVDPVKREVWDFSDNFLDVLPTQAFYLTTENTLVDIDNDQVQLDPLTGATVAVGQFFSPVTMPGPFRVTPDFSDWPVPTATGTSTDRAPARVIARSSVTHELRTTELVAAPLPGTPGAPTLLWASPGDANVIVAFSPAASNGSPVTGYTVVVEPGGLKFTGAQSPIMPTGLTNGVAYTFSVFATNSHGEGPRSVRSAVATPGSGTPVNPAPVQVK